MNWGTIHNIILRSDAINDWMGGSKGLTQFRFCKDDVNIRIDCTYDGEDVQNEDFKEDWANKHPNPKAVGYYFNLYYSATLLKRIILVSIDGGNALIPTPDSSGKVRSLDYKIAQIFDTLNNLDEYIDRSGLTK